MSNGNSDKEIVLTIKNVQLSFGGLKALRDINLGVRKGELLATIGPNGAGKTCILNCINGFYHPDKGEILYKNHDITYLPPHRIAKLGISRTFQHIELYGGMTTLDNLLAARHIHFKNSFLWQALRFGPALREEVRHREVVEEIIHFLDLTAIRKERVESLPYGLRRRVELGRALALEPTILLLDEPMSGMNLEEKRLMVRNVLDILEIKQIPVVLVEHDMGVVMDIADRIIVLDFGLQIAEGRPDEIRGNPDVIRAYLGEIEVTGIAQST